MISKHQSGHMALAFQLILAILIPSHVNAEPSVAKPGCRQECGGISIPYPFGVGNPSCYHNEWFEIVCEKINDSTTGVRPFLKRANLEVLELRLPTSSDQTGWIYANNPIVASSPNCSAGTNKASASAAVVNLTGSSFYYSRGYNSFGAAGCNNEVRMTRKQGADTVGCTSTCTSTTGIGDCCTSPVPPSLRVFEVSFTSSNTSGCKYAFIARSKWLHSYPSSACYAAVLVLDSVPAWVEWGFDVSTPEAFALAKQSARKNSSVGCTYYTYDDGLVVQFCFCSKGFRGNPYLPNGCQSM